MHQESTSSPHLPPKEQGSQENDPITKEIFNIKPLCTYCRDRSLGDILVHSTFSSCADHTQATPAGTFPYHRPWCPTCDFTGKTATITNTNRDVRLKGQFNCTVADVVCHHMPALSHCTLVKLVESLQAVLVNTCIQWRASNRTTATKEMGPCGQTL